MTLRQIIKRIFPAARTRITWFDAMPLILFLIVYAVTIILLDVFDHLTFTHPAWFALMIVSIWIWWMAINGWSGLNRRRSIQALTIRLLLVGTFVALLADRELGAHLIC